MEFRKLKCVNWRDVRGYEGLYKVSENGDVVSLDRNVNCGIKHNKIVTKKGRVLKASLSKGYRVVSLSKDNIIKSKRVHRLVAEAFLENAENLPQINHIDGNKLNNNVNNLEWCSSKHNIQHSFNIGLHSKTGIQKSVNACIKKNSRPVIQLTKENKFINEFKSITEAGKKTNINLDAIWCCLNGITKTSGGFVWKYKEVL